MVDQSNLLDAFLPVWPRSHRPSAHLFSSGISAAARASEPSPRYTAAAYDSIPDMAAARSAVDPVSTRRHRRHLTSRVWKHAVLHVHTITPLPACRHRQGQSRKEGQLNFPGSTHKRWSSPSSIHATAIVILRS